MIVTNSKFLRVHGKLQKVENAKEQQGAYVVSINAGQVFALEFSRIDLVIFVTRFDSLLE